MEEVGFEKYSMEKRVTKAEQKLSAYAKRVGMSEAGKHWLMAAIDPFHDKPLAIAGYPDGTPGKSLVQCIKLSADIAKPVNLPAGATWDVMLSTSNFLCGKTGLPFLNVAGGGWYNINTGSSLFTNMCTGGLTINKAISGSDLSIVSSTVATQTSTFLQPSAEFLEGRLRVLAMGFEVANTSSELYKNGSVTVFEIPQETPEERFTVMLGDGSGSAQPMTVAGAFSALKVARMPSSIAQATQITGSQTWEAQDGCYCVARQNGLYNPATTPKQVAPMMVYSDSGQPYPSPPLTVAFDTINLPGVPLRAPLDSYSIPFHSKGAYFTNLNENSTLRVMYNVWIERFPTPSEVNFLSLATESCDYDPQALEAWATIAGDAPAGVLFKENGLGDWFTGQVASLIDHWTGTTIASDVDKWQKNYALGSQSNETMGQAKRERMNTKAAMKGKAPRQGPMLANGGFKTQQAKNAKKNKPKPL